MAKTYREKPIKLTESTKTKKVRHVMKETKELKSKILAMESFGPQSDHLRDHHGGPPIVPRSRKQRTHRTLEEAFHHTFSSVDQNVP